ncbi:MAG: type I DNA topoisomerase [Actinobacteria bacterium]|nr:type I DNA topoisomerase [Actinomycetota bacterium]MDA2981406.1 type I DNA topoisomerase [Actinomycetota bacterium]MDA2996233.1 type I DNA topoisomerase [Actinomycetota bacterium]
MGIKLVIVESPAKARKIGGFLGDDYVVEASVGHIRDLPQRAADIPKEYKKIAWAKEGVNIEEGFEPLYVINPDKKAKVSELKALMKDADELILATDEDREGEAIAWHLIEVLRPKIPIRRMVFHEITKEAIKKAAEETRDLDYRLVDAQETRRVLDRLYGYRLSPVLWKKVMPRISAGRVQSVATRLIVERERERMAFISSKWWDLTAQCEAGFNARLLSLDGKRVAATNDFDANGDLKEKSVANILLLDEAGANELVQSLTGKSLTVKSTEESPRTERPKAPFTTSTMQQDVGSRLGWGAQLTMRVAQRLYENGYITYMRTDSVTLSQSAIESARSSAKSLYGAEYIPTAPRVYEGKSKNAQEAHEAIRPAGETFRTPGELAPELSRDEFSLYDLIWKRTIASQMSDAKKMQMRVDFDVETKSGGAAIFRANGSVVTFPGFLAAYEEIVEDKSGDDESAETDKRLPAMAVGDSIKVSNYICEGHETKPPARYTEPTLVKKLEELGIGRPSTFASIMSTIQDRGYVAKRGRALVPTFLAFSVTGLLEQHFGKLVDYEFTASMEEDLDRIANGEEDRITWLTKFFFGTEGNPGLEALAADLGAIDAQQINTMKMGEDIEIRVGRYGAYIQKGIGDDRKFANIPETMAPDELTLQVAIDLLAQPSGERELGIHPETNLPLLAKSGRFGPYITEVFPEPEMVVDKKTGELKKPRKKKDAPKPKTASLLSTMTLDTITIDDALKLMSLPRTLGDYEEVPITVQNGRYGPYMTHGTDSRTLTSEDQLFAITLDEAIELYKQPKVRRRGVAKPPLKDLGIDPASQKPVLVKDGRFGIYITDGETNATLRRGDNVEFLTLERGLELLAGRRAWEIENGGAGRVKKSSKRAKKAAPSLTKNTVKATGKAKSKKKAATGKGKAATTSA